MSEQGNSDGGRRPDFIAYNVRESRDGKGFFQRVGAAWPHRDGKGYDVQLDSIPLNGRVTLREMREERMQGYENERQTHGQEQGPEPERSRSRGRSR